VTGPLYIIGLPMTDASMTRAFLDFVDSPRRTILISSSGLNRSEFESSNDYRCARVGYDFLRNRGYRYHFSVPAQLSAHELQGFDERTVLCVDLWSSRDGRRHPEDVARDIMSIASSVSTACPDTRVGVLAQGNPLYRDERCARLISMVENCVVIASPSSADLTLELLNRSKDIPPSLPVKIYYRSTVDLIRDHINVYACLGNHYNVDVSPLINKLSSDYDVFIVKVGSGESVQRYPGDVFKTLLHLKLYRESLMDKTVVVVRSR